MSWIEEWSEDEYSPVLFFKLQGQPDSENRLEKDNFMLIIQTKAQKHLMRQFGGKGIRSDMTHGTTGYDFKLTSLLVSDELDEDIPVTNCISNKEILHFMEIFFKEVKSNCGFIARKWFMSDAASQFIKYAHGMWTRFGVRNSDKKFHFRRVTRGEEGGEVSAALFRKLEKSALIWRKLPCPKKILVTRLHLLKLKARFIDI